MPMGSLRRVAALLGNARTSLLGDARVVHKLRILFPSPDDDSLVACSWKVCNQADLDRFVGGGRLYAAEGEEREQVVRLDDALSARELLYSPYSLWATEFFDYRSNQAKGLEREVVKGIEGDAQARQAYGSLTALFEGESFTLQASVLDSKSKSVRGKNGQPASRSVMEIDGLLATSDPSVLLYVETKSTPTDRDVRRLVLRATSLGKALESSNPLQITNFPPELDRSRSVAGGVRIVALLGGVSFSPDALRAAKLAGVVPVVRSGSSFSLLLGSALPHAPQPPELGPG